MNIIPKFCNLFEDRERRVRYRGKAASGSWLRCRYAYIEHKKREANVAYVAKSVLESRIDC